MNRFLHVCLIALFIFPINIISQVQNTSDIKIVVSKEKSIINGILFYLHTVKKGENIYRIGLAYGVTQQEIYMANPDIQTGTIKEGQILKIPAVSVPNPPQLNNQNLDFKEYKVKKHDTEYSISKQFGITVDELVSANPTLDPSDLKLRQVVRIPVHMENSTLQNPMAAGPLQYSMTVNKDTSNYKTPFQTLDSCCDEISRNHTYQIALLLPFFLDENQSVVNYDTLSDPVDADKKVNGPNELFQRTINFIEFYQGALLAIDSLKKTGVRVKLYTYDAGRDTIKIYHMLQRPEMKNMDLIIGPFYSYAVEQVGRFAQENKIKMISPVWKNVSLLKSNPYLFEVMPCDSDYVKTMLHYIANIPNTNIILVNSNNTSDTNIFRVFKDHLVKSFPSQFKEYHYNDNSYQINSFISNHKTNIIILPTEDEAIASNILRMLNLIANSDSIKVFGLPTVLKWNTIEIECFHNLEFHFCSSFFPDYTHNHELTRFLMKYEKYNYSQPYFHTHENYPYLLTKEGYNFGYLGYDITFYFLSALSKFGPSFENCLNHHNVKLIHSTMDFERYSVNGGFINKGVYIMKFTQDYNLVKVN